MDKKICSNCNVEKLTDQFSVNKQKKDGFNYTCKECQKIYVKEHYSKNKQYYKDKAKIRCKEIRDWVREFRKTLKCTRCPEDHPSCMEFHHCDPKEKDFEIAKAASNGFTIKRILEEIAKCEILCSNCHRKLHWKLKNGIMPCECDGRTAVLETASK